MLITPGNQWRHRRRNAGFTLVELLVTLAVSAILLSVSQPSFTALVGTIRVGSASTDIYGALLKTRSEAIKRNTTMTLAPVQGSWLKGWQIIDPTRPGVAVSIHAPVQGLYINGPAGVSYRASGHATVGYSSAIVVSAVPNPDASAKTVCLNLSGQPSVNQGASC